MSSMRIFVSYSLAGDERGAECARRFIADLKTRGVEVITDNEHIPDKHLISYLYREFGRCEYFILIQTPQSLQSWRVQNAVNLALQEVALQRMRGALRLIAIPLAAGDGHLHLLQAMPRAFDASEDYSRARDEVLLELGLLHQGVEAVESLRGLHRPVIPPESYPADQRTQRPAIQQVPSSPAFSQYNDRPATPRARLAGRCLWVRLAGGMIAVALILGVTLVAMQATHHGMLTVVQPQRTFPRISTSSDAHPTPAITVISGINPQSTVDPYGAGNTLALSNDLTGENNSPPYQWYVSPHGQAHGCFFINHTYDMSSQGPNYCAVYNTNFANFAYQIQMEIVQGQAGGIIFRDNGTASTYYIFEITTSGRFFVLRIDSLHTAPVQLGAGSSFAIHTGLGISNVIAVDANGSLLTFYANAITIAQIRDSHYDSGNIGVIVGQPNDQGVTEAAYTYARVWTM